MTNADKSTNTRRKLFLGGAHTNGRMEVQKSCLSAKVLQEALKVQELNSIFFKALMCEFELILAIIGNFGQ